MQCLTAHQAHDATVATRDTSSITLHTRAERRWILELIFTFENLVLEVRQWQMAWQKARTCGFWGADAPLVGDNLCSCCAQTTHPRSANMRVLRQNEAAYVAFRRVVGGEKMERKTYVAALQTIGKIAKNWCFRIPHGGQWRKREYFASKL